MTKTLPALFEPPAWCPKVRWKSIAKFSQFPQAEKHQQKTSGSSLFCPFFLGKPGQITQRCLFRGKQRLKVEGPVFVHLDSGLRTKHTQNYHTNLPPPRVQKPRRFTQCDVFFPSNLEKRERRQLRGAERRGPQGLPQPKGCEDQLTINAKR